MLQRLEQVNRYGYIHTTTTPNNSQLPISPPHDILILLLRATVINDAHDATKIQRATHTTTILFALVHSKKMASSLSVYKYTGPAVKAALLWYMFKFWGPLLQKSIKRRLTWSSSNRFSISEDTVQEVLDYWFANSPSKSNSKLWMIPSENSKKRRMIDAEITDKFSTFLTDIILNFDEFMIMSKSSLHTKATVIIALDQLSRHIRRYHLETFKNNLEMVDRIKPVDLPKTQKEIDVLSVKVSKLALEQHRQEIDSGRVPLSIYIFMLMPFRHEKTIESVSFVQKCINDRTVLEEENEVLIRRFRNATNRRHTGLQDINRRIGCNGQNEWLDEDILEVLPFLCDMERAYEHDVVTVFQNFLRARGVPEIPHDSKQHSKSNIATFPIIVSLSGGVDSMVIASVLSYLRRIEMFNLHIIAVHIDYANRPESGAEARYVGKYCNEMGIEYRCRVIDEVTRGVTARDEYEKVARDARYSFYKRVQNEFQSHDGTKAPVLLGHHNGDLRENVLSNSMKGCGPLDLSGMSDVGTVEKVAVWRPLLPLEKDAVLDFAHKYGVPYFKDTTPLWSTRGKLRNKLLPLLCEMYGNGSMHNLSNLAVESDAAKDLFLTSLEPFFAKVKSYPIGFSFNTTEYRNHGIFFWRFVLRQVLHSHGRGMFTDKCIQSFMKRISADKQKAGWLQCRRDYAVYLDFDGTVYVIHPQYFPFAKKDQYDCTDHHVVIGKDPLEFHSWFIKATMLPDQSQYARLNEKPFNNMEEFMRGHFSYFLALPDDTPIEKLDIFTDGAFSKATRPAAWKSVDLKIESTLPLIAKFPKEDLSTKSPLVRLDYYIQGSDMLLQDHSNNSTDDIAVHSPPEQQNNIWDSLIQPFVAK